VTPLRVSMDLTSLLAGDTGVAQYTAALYAELSRRDDVTVTGFGIGRGPKPAVPMRRWPVPLRTVHSSWRRLPFPGGRLLGGPAEVLHSPDMVPPPSRIPLVLTMHDVLPLTMPDAYGPRFRRTIEQAVAQLPRVARVLTVCEATARELIRVCDVNPAVVVVTPHGRRLATSPTQPTPIVEGPYLLFVGSITPRKGLATLARALTTLGAAAPPLIVAGPRGYQADLVLTEVASSGADVRFLGRVDDPSLESLFRNAAALCHPSVAEGFGIPVLEALGFGTPVIAANIPSVEEISGGGARLVPPSDVLALAEAVTSLLDDPQKTAHLREVGSQHAAGYTWERTAAISVEAYRGAASSQT
jgi:glycosyltransferase involved in cell wall biosynthesis